MSTTSDQLIAQLKTLADLTRMRLIALCRQGECSVSELTEIIGQSQPRISQHLRALCDSGLLLRQRDGKRVFYRVSQRDENSRVRSQLLALIPSDDPIFTDDLRRLHEIRGAHLVPAAPALPADEADRAIYRAIIDLTVTAPIGSLLDIGCGRGQILKLLASRASRAIGVDIDASARELARAELMLAGIPDCSLRQGDMYRLPFDSRALCEARRLLKRAGRLLVLHSVSPDIIEDLKKQLATWSRAAGLRLAPARIATPRNPRWMLAVLTNAETDLEAA